MTFADKVLATVVLIAIMGGLLTCVANMVGLISLHTAAHVALGCVFGALSLAVIGMCMSIWRKG